MSGKICTTNHTNVGAVVWNLLRMDNLPVAPENKRIILESYKDIPKELLFGKLPADTEIKDSKNKTPKEMNKKWDATVQRDMAQGPQPHVLESAGMHKGLEECGAKIKRVCVFGLGSLQNSEMTDMCFRQHVLVHKIVQCVAVALNPPGSEPQLVHVYFEDSEYTPADKELLRDRFARTKEHEYAVSLGINEMGWRKALEREQDGGSLVVMFDPRNLLRQVLADLVQDAACEKPRIIICAPPNVDPDTRRDRSSTRVTEMLDSYDQYPFTAHRERDYSSTGIFVLKPGSSRFGSI